MRVDYCENCGRMMEVEKVEGDELCQECSHTHPDPLPKLNLTQRVRVSRTFKPKDLVDLFQESLARF